MVKRSALGLAVILAIIGLSVVSCSGAPQSVSHVVTISVPAVDVIQLSSSSVYATLQARDIYMGFDPHVLEAGDMKWITNDSPREITVSAQSIPHGLVLEVLKSLRPSNKWLELDESHALLIDDASCLPGTNLPREFSLFYRILATLEVPPDTYEITVVYTLTV